LGVYPFIFSGAGKTTLLNTFLHRNLKGLHVEGRVEINGNKIGRGITAISGYAQQEEMFVGTLTVREYLSIQARLRTNLSQERREKRVNVILAQLGLTKCQNNRIGVAGVRKGISGGEARRLTFACELLSNPGILFCDEPTTGLDSFMAEHVVVVLSKLASSGRTIVCTIHQPASQLFLMFDRVMLLAGGRTAFFGTPRECIDFFEQCGHPCPHNYNPADLIIHTLAVAPHEEETCRTRITAICDSFEKGNYGMALHANLDKVTSTTVPPGRRRVNFGIQIAALLHSYFIARTLSYLPLFSLDGLLMIYVCYWMVGFSSSVTQVLFATLISFLIEQSSCAFGMMLACIAPSYPRRDEVLAQYSFNADRFILDQLLMVAFIFVFYLIGYVGLSIRIYRSR
ncbi:ABC transporter, ATP-binding protein, partial [Teladorsagia circumcincta]